MECTCHVRVLWLWWWLYSTARALVCISWQMGFSAPLVLPVMMSHVPVYQTGHTQISPHLLLSQSPIPLPSVFIFLPLQASVFLSLHAIHTVSLSICPSGKHCPTGMSPSLPSNSHKVYAGNRQMVAWQLCRALRGSQDCTNNTVRCVNYRPLLMRRANSCPLRCHKVLTVV